MLLKDSKYGIWREVFFRCFTEYFPSEAEHIKNIQKFYQRTSSAHESSPCKVVYAAEKGYEKHVSAKLQENTYDSDGVANVPVRLFSKDENKLLSAHRMRLLGYRHSHKGNIYHIIALEMARHGRFLFFKDMYEKHLRALSETLTYLRAAVHSDSLPLVKYLFNELRIQNVIVDQAELNSLYIRSIYQLTCEPSEDTICHYLAEKSAHVDFPALVEHLNLFSTVYGIRYVLDRCPSNIVLTSENLSSAMVGKREELVWAKVRFLVEEKNIPINNDEVRWSVSHSFTSTSLISYFLDRGMTFDDEDDTQSYCKFCILINLIDRDDIEIFSQLCRRNFFNRYCLQQRLEVTSMSDKMRQRIADEIQSME